MLGFDGGELGKPEPWLVAGAAATLGRAMFLASQARKGAIKFTWSLVLEMPIALGMGFTAFGVCDGIARLPLWDKPLDLSGWPSIAAAIVAGHLGPRVLDLALAIALERWRGPAS